MKKWLALLLVATMAMAALFTGCTGATDGGESDFKVGFIYVGPTGDGGFTYMHDLGRKAVEEELGVETMYIESVMEDDNEVEKAVENMIDQGANMIFTTSYGFMQGTVNMAEKYPDVTFMHCSGYEMRENMSNYFGRIYQARYLTGIAAGMKTESNKIGYVAAMEIPEVVRGINAFTLGVRSVNPDAEVVVKWTHTWVDSALEKEAAVALLDEGCDVIAQHQDSPAPMIAAQERGKWGIGYHSDMSVAAPDAVLTSAVWDFTDYYVDQVKAAMDGTWKAESFWGGMDTGVVDITPLNESIAPEGAQEKIDEAKAKMLSGEWDVFYPPLTNQDGNVMASESPLTDEELLSMNWFVEGVVGSLSN